MARPIVVDTMMHAREGITAAFLLGDERGAKALVETGSKASSGVVVDALEAAGVEELEAILVTHIHLDHAGGAGTLVRRFPHAKVYVHVLGAPHLEDPAKLWASATRIYGDRMEELWGGIDPIPHDNIVAVADGETVEVAGRVLQAIETPGHAYHHHAWLDQRTGILFTGDALGVRLPDVGVVRPATPPPEFHLTKAIESIERIRALGPDEVWLTHFGSQREGAAPLRVSEACDRAIEALQRWASWVEEARSITADLDEATAIVKKRAADDVEGRLPAEAIERMEQTTSYSMNVWGYMRYFDKSERPGTGEGSATSGASGGTGTSGTGQGAG